VSLLDPLPERTAQDASAPGSESAKDAPTKVASPHKYSWGEVQREVE
jgi:hypothetical protein